MDVNRTSSCPSSNCFSRKKGEDESDKSRAGENIKNTQRIFFFLNHRIGKEKKARPTGPIMSNLIKAAVRPVG